MAATEQVSFTLLRFEWTPPDQLDVAGAWTGVDRSDLTDATLVLYGRGGLHRLEAVRGVSQSSRNWSAGFAWSGDPAAIERAELVLGDSLVVELPSSNSKQARRRFGRMQLPVRELGEQRAVAARDAAPGDTDVLALHAAMVAAQDEVAEARDEHARLKAEAERAREQARRERARRESDVARLQEEMKTLRRLAESSLEKEREATRGVSTQLDELEVAASSLRAEAIHLREQEQAAIAERDAALEQLRMHEPETERLRAKLDQLARDSRELSERAQAEVKEARARLVSVEAELVAVRAAGGEADQLRQELAGAQREIESARADAQRLQGKLTTLREVFEQSV